MRMVSRSGVQEVASAIAMVLSSTTDHHRRPKPIGTLDPDHLFNLALGALTTAAGEVVWIMGDVITKHPDEQLQFIKNDYSQTR